MDENRQNFGAKRHAGSFKALPDLRQSLSISDGGSICISNTERAQSFSSVRAGSHNEAASETYVASLIDDLQTSLQALDAYPSLPQLEEWATLIHECLSKESRQFHSVHHVFEISSGCDPLQLLGAFFRDSINCVTDGDLTVRQQKYVGTVLKEGYHLTNDTDRLLEIMLCIFGLNSGQEVSQYAGLDVFLSSVLMGRVLEDSLSEMFLAQIAVCMEATVPFRRASSSGKAALDELYERLEMTNERFELGLSGEEMVESIQRAADLSNRNLGNFASEDAVFFLDHTWSLLPERSSALRRSYLYSVSDMCLACRDMEIFLTNLDTSVVFQSFQGVPNQEEMDFFQQRLGSNLAKGRKYMRAKLLSVATCAAIATLSGGDAPMSFFTGDLPTRNYRSDRLGEDFPTFDYKELSAQAVDNDVYLILNRGRQLEQSFDTRNAPIAAYLYAGLGDDGVEEVLKVCEFPMTTSSSKKLLRQLPRENALLIINDIGKIALSRTEVLQELVKELFGDDEVKAK